MDQPNETTKPQDQFTKNILDKIKTGKVKMHSRAYFIGQSIAILSGIVLILLLAVLASSFLIFTLKATGRIFLPAYGIRGIRAFILIFPWITLLVIAGLVVIFEVLIRRYDYRRPFIYSVGIVLLILIASGLALSFTPLHSDLYYRAGSVPIAGQLYQHYGSEHLENLHRGIVSDVSGNQFKLTTKEGVYEVTAEPSVSLIGISDGDRVFVIGPEQGEQINAFGIKENFNPHFLWESEEFTEHTAPPPFPPPPVMVK
ncbi:MAG: hypothetical protein ACM3KM_04110 [Acidobacteriaceae bacterium]